MKNALTLLGWIIAGFGTLFMSIVLAVTAFYYSYASFLSSIWGVIVLLAFALPWCLFYGYYRDMSGPADLQLLKYIPTKVMTKGFILFGWIVAGVVTFYIAFLISALVYYFFLDGTSIPGFAGTGAFIGFSLPWCLFYAVLKSKRPDAPE